MKSSKNAGEVIVIAHRGGAQLFPENTLTAFRKAQELGVDAIEIDVHASKDGRLAVLHDPDLNRIAGVDRLISDMDWDEISAIELPGGERVPALEDVLREVDIPLVVELKSPETLDAIAQIFKENPGYIGRCIVISFFHEIIKALKEEFPGLTTGALLVALPVDPAVVAASCGADILSFHHVGLTREYVDRCHNEGILVSVWTPNTKEEIRASISAGADSIASDRPDLVLRALGR